jgi:uncharacterized protein (TIRG00374 family)
MRKLIKKIINEKNVVIFFKIFISLLLISYLIFDESIKLSLLFNSSFLHDGKLLILILIIFLTIIIGAYRWYLILKVFKFDISLYKVFKITYIGNLFNNLLLGGYGGDALRVHYICKASDKKKLTLFATVLIDRIIGAIGLFFVGFFFIFQIDGGLKFLIQIIELINVKYTIILLLILILIVFFFNFYLIPKISNFKKKITKFIEYLKRNIFTFLITINLSILIFLIVNFIAFFLSKYLFKFNINIEEIFISNTMAIFSSMIPITPGGLGIGEYSFSEVTKMLAGNQELKGIANVFLMHRLLNIFATLPALYFFFNYKNEKIIIKN